jgi:4-amino-4-deoxy-L-arabinose transferase-like glycosyltransferase
MRLVKDKVLILSFGALLAAGLFLYLYKLDGIPAGLYIDEALPGYNAYSLMKTGKDEYGKILPLVLRFYGSFNPPLYTYLTIIPVYIFGLSVFSVRLVSALAGLLSVIPFYLLLKNSKIVKNKCAIFASAMLFVISPWLVLHSRVGYEVSLAFLLFSWAV